MKLEYVNPNRVAHEAFERLYPLSSMLDCLPAFNVNRDQLKDTLESQILRACNAERDLRNIAELAKELAQDIDLEGMKSDALTRYEAYVRIHP
jgi:hypothetical protein